MTAKPRFAILLCCLVFPVSLLAQPKPLFPVGLKHEFKDGPAAFDEARKLILEHYYSDEITEEALYLAAIQGMLHHVSPPENRELGAIYPPATFDQVSDALNGVQVSIGIRSFYNANDGSLTVTEIMPDSPADDKLKPLDRILRVDDKTLKGMSHQDIDKLLRGKEDSKLKLTVVRDIEIFELSLVRKQFKMPNLNAGILQNKVGYIEVKRISAGVSGEIKEELKKFEEEGIHHLLLDFRNNGGGVLNESLKIAELFLPEKSIVLRTVTRANKLQNFGSSNKEPHKFRVAVLVNGKTASSCEIITAALRDHNVAFVVGEKTYGKSVFEKMFTLGNDYRMKFIIGAMYTPVGKSWQTRGITPDFAATQDEKTYAALTKLPLDKRLPNDSVMLTGFKLLQQMK